MSETNFVLLEDVSPSPDGDDLQVIAQAGSIRQAETLLRDKWDSDSAGAARTEVFVRVGALSNAEQDRLNLPVLMRI